MGIARSFIAMAALGLATSCQPQTPAQPLTETQVAEHHRIEREATLSDLRRHTRATTGTPLRTVLVKVPSSEHCAGDANQTAEAERSMTDLCQEEFTSLLGERIDTLLADRATNGTCTLRDVEVLHARIVWRGMGNGGPATLPSGAIVFLECCGEPTPYPCSEIDSQRITAQPLP